MTQVLAAVLLAAVLSIVVGGRFIRFLHARSLGQHIREEGPAGHKTKQGTPTMGGVLIIAITAISFLAFSDRSDQALCVLAVTLLCAGIGFIDDFSKIVKRRSLGLAGRWKMVLLMPVVALLAAVAHHTGVSTDVYVPLLDFHVDLGVGWYVLVYLVVAGAANGVNLTDGLDGLAAGTTIIAVLCYTAICLTGYIVSSADRLRRASTSRSSAPRCSVPASDSSGTTASRPTSSWGTPARSGSAAGSRRSRSSRRPSCSCC